MLPHMNILYFNYAFLLFLFFFLDILSTNPFLRPAPSVKRLWLVAEAEWVHMKVCEKRIPKEEIHRGVGQKSLHSK